MAILATFFVHHKKTFPLFTILIKTIKKGRIEVLWSFRIYLNILDYLIFIYWILQSDFTRKSARETFLEYNNYMAGTSYIEAFMEDIQRSVLTHAGKGTINRYRNDG